MNSLDVAEVDYLKKELLWQIKDDIEKNPRHPEGIDNPYTPYGLDVAAEEEFNSLFERGFIGMDSHTYDDPDQYPGVQTIIGMQGVGSTGTLGTQGISSGGSGGGYPSSGGGGGYIMTTGGGSGTWTSTSTSPVFTITKKADGSWGTV